VGNPAIREHVLQWQSHYGTGNIGVELPSTSALYGQLVIAGAGLHPVSAF